MTTEGPTPWRCSFPRTSRRGLTTSVATMRRSLACDRYTKVGGNLAAIAATIEATRAIDRYGVATLDQAFAGYTALPPSAVDWRLILGLNGHATLDQVEEAYHRLALDRHPDRGGTHADMARLNEARDRAREELGAR